MSTTSYSPFCRYSSCVGCEVHYTVIQEHNMRTERPQQPKHLQALLQVLKAVSNLTIELLSEDWAFQHYDARHVRHLQMALAFAIDNINLLGEVTSPGLNSCTGRCCASAPVHLDQSG